MTELVFLVEEASAAALLQTLLPRIISSGIGWRVVPFEGKQDLERQITRRIRAYQNPYAKFIVLRDQDSHPDCRRLKANLLGLCAQSGRQQDCMVRIACTELETFYLADLAAVEAALQVGGLGRHQQNRKFRAPDKLANPSTELRTLTRGRYQKVAGSRILGAVLDLENTRSASFQHLIQGIRKLEASLATLSC